MFRRNNSKNIRQSIINRTRVIYGLVILTMLVILSKALVVKMTYDGSQIEEEKSHVVIKATRGNILAIDGRTLACSVPKYKLEMDPCAGGLHDSVFNKNIDKLAIKLSSFFGDKSAYEYKAMISTARQQGKHFISINRRHISYDELKIVKEFPIFNRGRNRGGFRAVESTNRKLPFGMLAARTIGKLYKDKQPNGTEGWIGIENSYDEILRGKDGICNRIRITGEWIEKEIVAPEDGKDIITTIDVDMQDVAENSLLKQLKLNNADHGIAILMEVKTGAIRAIVNLNKDKNGNFVEDIFNSAIGELADPGSTFKLATTIVCLEDKAFTLEDTINTFDGTWKASKDAILRDSHRHDPSVLTMKQAFETSSNIAFGRMVSKAYGNNPQLFIDRLRDLGLTDSLQIDIKGTRPAEIKDPSDKTWSGISLPWMSIGYELRITPLQLLTLYNAVANDGKMMNPMFVDRICEHGNVVKQMRPKVIKSSIASHSTIEQVQTLLKGVVEHGTAQNIKGTPYGIAGKTGTAQLVKQGGGYEKRYLASFAGYFPADNPMYSCIVMVYGPSGMSYYGNVVAGPVVKAIADRVYAAEYREGRVANDAKITLSAKQPYSKGGLTNDILRTMKVLHLQHNQDIKSEWLSASAQEDKIQLKERHFVEYSMPDVIGMGASDAVSLLESMGLKVQITGFGRVTSQSIAAGTKYIKGTTIQISLTNG